MNINKEILKMINDLRMDYPSDKLDNYDVEIILDDILRKGKVARCKNNIDEKYGREEEYFLYNLNGVGDNKEMLKEYISEEYVKNNDNFFFDFIEKLLKLYKKSNDDGKRALIKYAMRIPEVLISHDIVVIEM